MHEKYLQLFQELIHAVEILSEQVMEYNHQKQDAAGEETAQKMRDDYAEFYDRLRESNYQINLKDVAKLLIATYVITENMQTKIKQQQLALNGYKDDIMPKLNRLATEAKTDEEAQKLAKEIFQIKE